MSDTNFTNSINPLLQPSRIPGNRVSQLLDGGTVALRDYQHAARIFVDGNFRLSPKYGFLFYVEFDFNPMITNVSNTAAQELGMIVKSVSLPKFSIETKVHNAYNRKNIIQNRINYDPVSITFHDDQADNVRNFWYDYYSFFYRDSDYADGTYQIISKYQERPSFEWGYSPRNPGSYNSAVGYQDYQYIQGIRIYSLYQGNFSEYELINPMIQSFKHGEHTNGDNTLLEHQMTVQFETVKYQTGYVTQNTAGGFVDLHYDNITSPLATTAGADVISNGQGGYTSKPSTTTDLADNNLQTAGGTVVPPPNFIALNAGLSLASALGNGLSLAGGVGTNAGGFALPSLGSLTSGLSNGNLVNQQLNSAAVSLAGQAATGIVGGVVTGITQGLGPGGTQAVGLAVAAITNPSAALHTVESMAIRYASAGASSLINSVTSQITSKISTTISGALGDLNSTLGESVFGSGTLTGGIGQAFGEAQVSFSNSIADINPLSDYNSGGDVIP